MKTPSYSGFGSLSRRDLLRYSGVGLVGCSMSGWLEALAATIDRSAKPRKACILLWMTGGPSQMDTFDLKPGTPNGGSFKEIKTAVPGIRISEHLPKLAEQADQLAIIRSMSTKEGDHGRATYMVRTGYLPQPQLKHPTLGSLISKELGTAASELPNFVSISPNRTFNSAAYGPGFLGSQYAPLMVGDTPAAGQSVDQQLKVEDLEPPPEVPRTAAEARIDLLGSLNKRFIGKHRDAPALGYQTAYDRAIRLVRSRAGQAFNLDDEPAAVRDAYGRNRFGQGCLLARRLIEHGVPFVEVTLSGVDNQGLGWDTHAQNFEGVKRLSDVLDPAWAMLMKELKQRGLLESTLIVWAGEFGRTPQINGNSGRDHFPQAWSTVLAGGPIKGGQVIGRTSPDGMTVQDRPVGVPDLLATVCRALDIDPMKQNESNLGRPIRVVDPAAKAIKEVVG